MKANQKITHIKRLKDVADFTSEFVASLQPLDAEKKLGPVLFQLPPYLKCDVALLKEFLAGLPRSLRSAFEFRHVSWFTDEVYEAMRGANAPSARRKAKNWKPPTSRQRTSRTCACARKIIQQRPRRRSRLKWRNSPRKATYSFTSNTKIRRRARYMPRAS